MKSIIRFHWMNKKHHERLPVASKFLLLGAVIAFGIFLIIPTAIPTHGFHKETALLKKYNNLQDLVKDIRNGKVDFKDFRQSDGIDPSVMKGSDIYEKADIATKDCIDIAGKVGNNLGDREIVHCSEDPNYFKNKFSSNTNVSTNIVSPSKVSNVKSDNTISSSSTSSSPISTQNDLVDKLVKTGRFTVNEAKEFVKAQQGGTQKTVTNGSTVTSSADTSPKDQGSMSAKTGN